MSVRFLIIALMLIVGQAVTSYLDGFFSQSQMAAKGYPRGLAFLGHGQMWTDLFIIAPLVAVLIYRYSGQWNGGAIYVCVMIAALLSGVMHYLYKNSPVPGCHAHDGYITTAGWIHFVFMAAVFAVILLFWFHTTSSKNAIVAVGLGLFVHVVVGAIQIPAYLGERSMTFINGVQFVGGTAAILIGSFFAWRRLAG